MSAVLIVLLGFPDFAGGDMACDSASGAGDRFRFAPVFSVRVGVLVLTANATLDCCCFAWRACVVGSVSKK